MIPIRQDCRRWLWTAPGTSVLPCPTWLAGSIACPDWTKPENRRADRSRREIAHCGPHANRVCAPTTQLLERLRARPAAPVQHITVCHAADDLPWGVHDRRSRPVQLSFPPARASGVQQTCRAGKEGLAVGFSSPSSLRYYASVPGAPGCTPGRPRCRSRRPRNSGIQPASSSCLRAAD